MTDYDRMAGLVCRPYRGHVDYEDLMAVARIAAWKHPEHAFKAAQRAVLDYLRSPMNRTRVHTQTRTHRRGNWLPEAITLSQLEWEENEGIVCLTEDPARHVINRFWYEWLVDHPSLTAAERLVIQMETRAGESLTAISRQADRSDGWAWNIRASAVKKLRRILSGEHVPASRATVEECRR